MAKKDPSNLSETDLIQSNLWSIFNKDHPYHTHEYLFQAHLLEQYKIYVEMADRISARRNLANGFFLTLHSTILTALGLFADQVHVLLSSGTMVLLLILSFFLCLTWWWLIRSYRNLNSAKYKVIGQLEEKLPASPYYRAEWAALGEGKSLKKYLPLTFIEQWIPMVFWLIYISFVGHLCLQ